MKKLITLSFALGGAVALQASTPTWVFKPSGSLADGGSGMIVSSDGVWELNVRIVKASEKTISLGAYTDAQATGGGHAFVKGSGDLDLRGVVTRESTSEAWSIINLAYGSLGRGASTGFLEQGSLYAPLTLTAMNRCFVSTDNCCQSFTNVVVESAKFTSLSEQVFTSGVDTNLNRLVFKAPALASIPKNGFSVSWANPDNATQPKLWGSSYDEWDLTGVTTVGSRAFLGRHIHGTLDLPKVAMIGERAFHECTNMMKVLLSPELKQLKLVDEYAFNQLQYGGNRYVDDSTLMEIVMGGAFGFTIKTNAFNGQSALVSVSFTGVQPTYDIDYAGIVFGTKASVAKTMAFYVPDNAEWADVIAQATPATDAEKSAWSEAHPDCSPVWGVIPASVFHTANDQYIGFYSKRVSKPKIFFDARLGDSVTFESLGPSPAASDGSWPTNNRFRITATVGDGGTFTRWYGDLPKGLCGQQTIEVSGDKLVDVRWLLPRITHPWTFDTSAKTISNGIWELHVFHASTTQLTLGNDKDGTWGEIGRALTGTGSGYLDLGGPITDKNGNSYTIANFQGGNSGFGSTATKAGPSVFVSPGTLTKDFLNYKHFLCADEKDSDLEVLVVDEPSVTGGFTGSWLFSGTAVQYLQFIVPRLPSIAKNAFNRYGLSPFDVNFSVCDFSSITNIGEQAFYFCSGVRGELDLPSIKSMGAHAFNSCISLQAVHLATNRNEAVSEIATSAFANCLSLEKIALDQAEGTTWPQSGLSGCPVREVRFFGPPPTRESLSNMLRSLPETTGAKPCTVYGSCAFGVGSWRSLASAPTAEETAAFRGNAEDLIGVFRKDPASAPTMGCAWVVNRPSPWDPRGFLFLVR